MGDSLSPRFDGMSVEILKGKFRGDFDSPELQDVKLDDEVYFLVRSMVKGVTIGETRAGDLQRTNVFELSDVLRLDEKTGLMLEAGQRPQLTLDGAISFHDEDEDGE